MIDYRGKRLFDFMISVLSLFFLWPIFLLVIIAIFLFDNGPIFFTQKRIGKNGNPFLFFKFRSLPVDTINTPSSDLNKVNISMIGKIIRRTSIDELPQLLNILKGDMSIVGPRPSLPSQKELNFLRSKGKSFLCRPGLTGLAQVCSFENMSYKEKALLDEKYARNTSIKLDIIIILRTFKYLLSEPPKY